MSLVSGGLIYDLVAFVVTLLAGVVIYYKWSFTYWKRRGFEYLEPSIPFGNCGKLFMAKSSFSEQFADFYKQFKQKGLKYGGAYLFTRPLYIVTDPSIVKDVMQKNFSHFVNRGLYVNEEVDLLVSNLFALEDEKWKNLRAKLTATFTSGKMKMLFHTMASCATEMKNLMTQAVQTKEPIDIKEVLARFTTDVISSCAFGLESNCLKDPNTEFRYYGKRIFDNTFWEGLKGMIQFMFPRVILKAFKFKFTKPDVEKFMFNLVKETVDYREKNNVQRNDLLQLLLELKNGVNTSGNNRKTDNNISLTFNELAAQVFVFFAGGYETSATTMTFTLYELSRNQEIQDKLRKEIKSVLEKNNNETSYDAIMEMTYMDQVVNETLRKHTPLGFLTRHCTKDYKIPNTKLYIEKGTMVGIPVQGLHHDPEYYPEPSKYDPDRFSDENKKHRVPFTWIPFGEGPRICIGLRFGLLQVKIGLTTLLRDFRVTLSDKTEIPLVLDKKSLIKTSETGIWLNVSKLD